MISVNDYHSAGNPLTIYACPKCKAYAEYKTDSDGFVEEVVFKKNYKFDEFELKQLKRKCGKIY